MTLEQFIGGLNRWGAALAQWPEHERAEALSLLDACVEAQEVMAEEIRLEAFLRAHDPGRAVDRDAVVRMVNSVMARLPAAPPPRSWWAALQEWSGLGGSGREWAPRFAISMAVAMVLGLLVGDRLPSNDSQNLSPMEALAMSTAYNPLDLR